MEDVYCSFYLNDKKKNINQRFYTYFEVLMELSPLDPPSYSQDGEEDNYDSDNEQYEDQSSSCADLFPVSLQKIDKLPHRLIGAVLKFDTNNKFSPGTGVLISPDLVFTSAANIYNIQKREPYKTLKFQLGHGPSKKCYSVISSYFPEQFASSFLIRDDYGLLRLQRDTDEKQFMYLRGDVNSIKSIPKESVISSYGYMQDNPTSMTLTQYGSASNRRIFYWIHPRRLQMRCRIYNFEGQIGSPILMDDGKGNHTIIGIQRGRKYQVSSARLVTNQLIEQIIKRASQLHAKPFIIPTHENLFLRGCIQENQNKNKEAQQCFRQFIKKNPENAQGFAMLALVLLKLGRPKQSLQEGKKALSLNYKMAQVHNCMAEAHISLNQPQEARKRSQMAIEIDPKYAQAYNNMGQALDKIGQFKEAIKWLEQAILLDKTNAKAHNNIGVAFKELGQINRAEEQYRCSIELDHNYKFPYYNLLSILKQPQKIEEGIKFLEKVIEKNPGCAIATQIHGLLRQRLQRFQ